MNTLPPCPNCGSEVEVTNSRDGNILFTYVECDGECQGMYFLIESEAFAPQSKDLLQTDFEIVAIKYQEWVRGI